MTLSRKGAAILFAALVSAAPIAAAAETLPAGPQNGMPAYSTSTESTDILLAMLASPASPSGGNIPLGGAIVPICHRSAGGCDGDGSSGGSSPSKLKFPSPRGKVIFEHSWSSSDIPSSFQTPGGGKPATFFAKRKFRLPGRPDGRFKIVTDSETGAKVLDILVTRKDEARTGSHHTEIEVHIPNYWTDGRFMKRGERYLLEYWRKNVNYRRDSKWEIWWQNHSKYDRSSEKSRNPAVSLGTSRKGDIRLFLRADSKSLSYKKDGRWTYTRESSYKLSSSPSSSWELWQMEIKIDHYKGAMHVWRNGNLVHSEEGLPVGYNDKVGPPWQFGWYKYFSGSSVDSRQAYIGPVRVQKL